MEKKAINAWEWQDALGFSQAIEVREGRRILYCSGQASMDGEGRPAYPASMRDQIKQSVDNLERVLREAGFDLADVVRLNYYTTDVDQFFNAFEVVKDRLADAGCKPASTLLGVTRLAFPELMVEIEATAMK